MAYLDVQFYSRVLGLSCTMGVILPEADQGIGVGESVWDGVTPLPVLYLLHGMSDNHTIWMRRTSLDRYAAGRKLAIVMPSAGRSYYSDQKYGLDYLTFIGEELPAICRRFFRISDRREENFIAGLSMGGYGALKAALNYPDTFSYAASMSGVLDLEQLSDMRCYEKAGDESFLEQLKAVDFEAYRSVRDYKLCFGSPEEFRGSSNDLCALVDQLAAKNSLFPRLHLSIGTEDYLYGTNITFRRKLDEHGVDYTYLEFPGTHEWSVWDKTIPDVLDWLPIESSRPTGNGGAERAAQNAAGSAVGDGKEGAGQ